MSTSVLIRRHGNTIEVSTDGGALSPVVASALEGELSYVKRIYLSPVERRERGTNQGYVHEQRLLFDVAPSGALYTCAGFLQRVIDRLAALGVGAMYRDDTPLIDQDALQVDKRFVEMQFQYRPRQEEALDSITSHRMGQVIAPTGAGKMALVAMTCLAMPRARIDVVTRRTAVVESLVAYLSRHMGGVGQVGAGRCVLGDRVTVYTADSLHKSPKSADVVLADEGHELLADRYASQLAGYRLSRMFAFTASPRGRADGADVRLEALFGRPVFEMTYPEAVALGLVVPIRVEWSDVTLEDVGGRSPVLGVVHDVERKRRGVWRNAGRNRIVADKALSFGNAQTLVVVETLEHLVNLLPLLPGYAPIYATCEEADLRRYRRQGLIGSDFPILDRKARARLKAEFESGELRGAVATGVWSVGVDFTHLECVVRADAGASEIASIQTPGRVARRNDLGKEVGVLADFHDQFDDGFRRRAMMRQRHYRGMGWDQVTGG